MGVCSTPILAQHMLRIVALYIYIYISSSPAPRNSYSDRRFVVGGLAHGAARGTPLLRLEELKFGGI
jgi:hypothetical protein